MSNLYTTIFVTTDMNLVLGNTFCILECDLENSHE